VLTARPFCRDRKAEIITDSSRSQNFESKQPIVSSLSCARKTKKRKMSCPSLLFNVSCLCIRFLTILAYLCVGAAVFRTFEKDSKGTKVVSKPEIEQYFDWFHFAFTSTTTIGDGQVVPTKSSSKLFYIFYAAVGIPLMLWYLSLCGQIQTEIYGTIMKSLRTCFWHQNDKSYKDIGPVIISLLVLVIFWFVGAISLHKSTDLSLLDCIYFWFTTFTTTGFGDVFLIGNFGMSVFYAWMVYKWFLLNLAFGVIHSILVWIHGFSDVKQGMCCICWHPENYDDASTVARYNLELAKRQEFMHFHRASQF